MIASIQLQEQFFKTGDTYSYHFRIEQLKKLLAAINKHEEEIYTALQEDLGKSKTETFASEIALVKMEIKYFLQNLKQLMQPHKVPTNVMNLPGSSKILYKPLGVVLIIAPWNYPFQLLFNPLVGAIAAGNCVVLKPSELTPKTAHLCQQIIETTFNKQYIQVVQGIGATVVPQLIEGFRFNHIFFTGSTTVGKAIYVQAAKQLIPVTLELGGKSPCVVTANANIKVAAKRIALGKCINAGQTCVAPDYVLVHESVKNKLIEELKICLDKFYPLSSNEYGKIINTGRLEKLITYLNNGKIVYGGKYDKEQLYFQPTILTDVNLNSTVMQEEIFGSILPIVSYTTQQEALAIIEQNSHPLAFYLFTHSKQEENDWLQKIPFGGGCVNNTLYHLTNHHLPFGGVGNSGIGNYHGAAGFYTFSHQASVLKTPTWFDPAIKYPPFAKKLKLFKWLMR